MTDERIIYNSQRIRITANKLILDLRDNCSLPFNSQDFDWMAKAIEKTLQQRFDVNIEDILIKRL